MEYDGDIFDAAEFGDLETLESFWTDQINVDWQDLNGMDLIMTACKFGNEEIVTHLLTYKPNLAKKNNDGHTALDIARKGNHENIIKILSEA